MTYQGDLSQFPVFLVVGRTRVGKGEFISTTHRILKGSALPNIVSNRLVSHTKETKGYPVSLGKRHVRMVDTVGFDNSNGTDIPEETLLRFLEETGKADFYPPLVIVQTLSALEKDLLMKISAVFSEIVVAIRMDDASALDETQYDIAEECQIAPVEIFHLQGFVSAKFDGGNSRRLYDAGVLDILDFYSSLIPSRRTLNFSSPLFAGEYVKTPCPPETKGVAVSDERRETRREKRTTKVPVRVTLADGGHYEETHHSMAKAFNWGSGACSGIGMQAAITAAAASASPAAFIAPVLWACAGIACRFASMKASEDVWVSDLRQEIAYLDEEKEVDVRYIVTQKLRRTFERDVQEVWKILAGEIKIFKGYEYGAWKEVGDERLDRFETELCSDLPEGKTVD